MTAPPDTKSPAPKSRRRTPSPKPAKAEKSPLTLSAPPTERKRRKSAKETAAKPPLKPARRPTPPQKQTAFREHVSEHSAAVASSRGVSAPLPVFEARNFESYCLRHWGKINLYFLLPASISPPLLGEWLTPAGLTPGFAVLVFLATLGSANLLSFLLILLLWALKGS